MNRPIMRYHGSKWRIDQHSITGMTMCSGIGAPELAAPWVDWRFASETEPFPRAVLTQRFPYVLPDDHNQGDPLLWGDMTEITPTLLRDRGIPLPDLIVAGTPCQDFSVAGLRAGTDGDRGNLTLKFVEICHDIVAARPDGKLCVVWENVPGILSDRKNAFGCFLGGLVGSMDALLPGRQPAIGKSNKFWKWVEGGTINITDEDGQPTGQVETVEPHHRPSWPGEGMVEGPRARAAWSVLDAQWFGVAQRRRRLFVVVDFGNCTDPAAILLEPDRLRGDTPPRREAGKGIAADVAACLRGGGNGTERVGDSRGQDNVVADWPAEIAPTLNASFGDKMGLEDQHALAGGGCSFPPHVANTLTQRMHKGINTTLDEGQTPIPMLGGVFDVAHTLLGKENDSHAADLDTYVTHHLSAEGVDEVPEVAGALCRDSFSGGASGRPEGAAVGHFVPVAFDCKGTEVQFCDDDTHPTLRAMGHSSSHQNAGGHAAVAEPYTLMERGRETGRNLEFRQDGTANAVLTPNGGRSGLGVGAIATPWAVRRLTPRECERLQDMPDDHTQIPWRGKAPEHCPDGNRYKAIGNSMAVSVMRWILDRVRISFEIERNAV